MTVRRPASRDYWTAFGISLALHVLAGGLLWGTWDMPKPDVPETTVELTWAAAPQKQAAPGLVSGPSQAPKAAESSPLPVSPPAAAAAEPAPGPSEKPKPAGASENPSAEKQPAGPPPVVSFPAAGGPDGLAIIPPKLRERPAVILPAEAARAGIAGDVLLTVEILENGRVGKVSMSRSSGSAILDAAARDTVARWLFEPARLPQGGLPVRVMASIWVRYAKAGS